MFKFLKSDWEFVGNEWFKWLNDSAIQYHIRIRDNFWVEDPRTGRKIRAQHIFANLKHGEECILYRIYRVCGELCYLAGAGGCYTIPMGLCYGKRDTGTVVRSGTTLPG